MEQEKEKHEKQVNWNSKSEHMFSFKTLEIWNLIYINLPFKMIDKSATDQSDGEDIGERKVLFWTPLQLIT